MKTLCFGTLLKILCQAHTEGISDVKMCESIFIAYDYEAKWYNDNLRQNVSKLKSAKINVPKDLSKIATLCDREKLTYNYNEKVVPLLSKNLQSAVILAIIKLIEIDTSIDENDTIGFEGYSKGVISNNNTFELSSFLASMFQYAITSVENSKCKSAISKIKKDYVLSLKDESKKIKLSPYDFNASEFTPIERTINDEKFKEVFINVSKNIIGKLSNQSNVSIYKFDIQNNAFKYNQLKEYLLEHISDYVCSRSQLKSTNSANENKKIIPKAIIKFINNSKESINTSLGEILIYVFLEQELNAPKLMSKIELKNDGNISKSDGIHLLSIPTKDGEIHQIVFGVSNIVDDYKNAIDTAFNKILKIEKNENAEFKLFDPETLNKRFDDNTSKFLLSILRPNKNDSGNTDNAYGIFIGYTLEVEINGSNIDFRKKIDEKLNKDIKIIEKYILQKVKENHLEGFSFYVYIIPFNDAQKEKAKIINEIVEGV